MSRVTPPFLPPLELDGIRYSEIRTENSDDIERRCGFVRATNIADRKVLWELQVYKVERDEDRITSINEDRFFLRFKFMPDMQHILVENEWRDRYLVNIHTQSVREATDADFPPELIYKPRQPHYVPPIYYRNMVYMQDLEGFFVNGGDKRSGYLFACKAATMKVEYSCKIYDVPFNHDIEHDQQECYFRRMELLPYARHILIVNQDGQEFLYDIRRCKSLPFNGNRVDYHYKYLGILNRIKYFFLDLWDDLRGKEY